MIHLHVHNEYSQLDGYGSAEQYAAEAKRLGQKALALTNHSNVDGAIKFQKACQAEGIKPIHGCELYVVKDLAVKAKDDTRYHMTVLVKDAKGWQNLLRMLTIANLEGFYRKPRVDPETVLEHCEGLVILSACSASFIKAPWGLQLLSDLKERLGSDVYLEIMPHDFRDQVAINKLALQISQDTETKLVATNDCHYPARKDAKLQEVMLAMQSKAKWKDPSRWSFSVNTFFLSDADWVSAQFSKHHPYLGEKTVQKAIQRTHLVARKCNFTIPQLPVNLPKVPGYENEDETELLKVLVNKGLRKRVLPRKDRLKKGLAEYKDRIREELGLICELGFQRYFLIVWDLIRWCKSEGQVMVGPGRGSVGGCLVAYCLDITDVDPLEYDLLFSRFISPARIDLPDIDMDFEDSKRDRIRARLEESYGKECVAGLSTFLTMKGRGALRDVSRVFEIPQIDVDKAAKSIVVRSGGDFRSDFTIEDAFETFEDGIAFKKKYPEIAQYAMRLEGTVKGSGQHAAAMCISAESLKDGKRCNLAIRSGVAVANWDKYDSEHVGLMKLDILGLSTLTVLSEAALSIKANWRRDIIWDQIPLDDPKVYEQIRGGYTVGAFQIGSPALARYCKDLLPENFDDLVHLNALWRPGTLRTGMTTEFAARKNKRTKWDYEHPSLKKLTQDTFGIILYQEQVMQFMYEFAGLPWKTCDTVRKVISKSQGDELFLKFKGLFAEGCVAKGTMSKEAAEKLWQSLASFGSYSFNKSHSVEYSMISYWCMWLKVHYPAEYMAAALSYSDPEKKQELVRECLRLGLKIAPPKVGISAAKRWKTAKRDLNLYAPFLEVKGVGEKTAQALEEISAGDREALKPSRSVNKTVFEKLVRLKALSSDSSWTEDEVRSVKDLLTFDFSQDPLHSIRGIYHRLKRVGLAADLKDVDFSRQDKNFYWYFGEIPELRFGYRKNVLKAAKTEGAQSVGVEGTSESLGGAYGTFTDYKESSMLVFNSSLYASKKSEVEHCGGQLIAVKAHHPQKHAVLFADDIITEESLLSCDIQRAKLVEKVGSHTEMLDLASCKLCSLREECKKPVPPSSGKYNLAIVGEAPGRSEDSRGEGFLGDAGKLLWKELDKCDLDRNNFLVTNVVKCWPSKSKTPNSKQIQTCSKWLDKELEQHAPVLVLALGATPLKYFKGVDVTGITQLSGQTEWSPKHSAWVCWSVHPASVLYHSENKPLLVAAVENFASKIRSLGLK